MADHGKLFDNFSASPSHTHGGSYFDAGFGLQTLQDAHDKLYDLFGVPKDSAAHGEHFDEFGWREMPAIHGQQFDSDFHTEIPQSDGHHGRGDWYDVFRGGTQVRYVLEGMDVEGTITHVNDDHAVVRSHDGQTHEVGLSQFLAYRTPNEEQASPTVPASDADAPSAHSADAHGAFREDRSRVPTDMPPVIQQLSPGQYTEPRTGVPAGAMDTFHHLKSLVGRYEADEVAKSVDSTETAVQGQPTGKTVGHRANCPRGGSAPCGADVKGKCTLCGEKVRDHEAVGKIASDGSQIPARGHKSTDHHSSQRKPGRCPHCGEALELLDEKTEQGHPDRKEKEGAEATFDTVSHKCMGTTLDILKSLTEVAS